jgi:hypothetical protein
VEYQVLQTLSSVKNVLRALLELAAPFVLTVVLIDFLG